jgi:hypothetical protein
MSLADQIDEALRPFRSDTAARPFKQSGTPSFTSMFNKPMGTLKAAFNNGGKEVPAGAKVLSMKSMSDEGDDPNEVWVETPFGNFAVPRDLITSDSATAA